MSNLSEEEAIKEIENYLDYEGSVSINAIATLYTLYNKEKEKNKEYIENTELLKKYIRENYINKAKIKEKIKWYEETCKHLSKNGLDLDRYDQYQGAIEALQELLEEVE